MRKLFRRIIHNLNHNILPSMFSGDFLDERLLATCIDSSEFEVCIVFSFELVVN